MPLTSRRFLLTTLVLVATLSACGGGDGDSGSGSEDTTTTVPVTDADVTVVADDIDFPTTEYTAAAGTITIAYRNEGAIRHTLVFDGDVEFGKLTVDKEGDVDSGTATLEAGKYTIYCDVSGHRAAGMEATLTVE